MKLKMIGVTTRITIKKTIFFHISLGTIPNKMENKVNNIKWFNKN